MQFEGGYRYPSTLICILLSSLAFAAGFWFWHHYTLSAWEGFSLLLTLEGTVLLASAFAPKGLVPPPKGIANKLRWFFKEQAGVPVSFNQPLFYVGVFFLLSGILLSNFTD